MEDKEKIDPIYVDGFTSALGRGDQLSHSSSINDTHSSNSFSLSIPDLSTSILMESNFPYNLKKAVFTFLLPNYQIIDVNSAACQLLNYTSQELVEMKLDNLIHESHKPKLYKLLENCLKGSNSPPFSNGKLVDFVCAEDEILTVYLYLKEIENSERYVAVAEPLNRKMVFVTVDVLGKILSCDEETALLFQYDLSELVGVSIHSLLPAINLPKEQEHHWKPIIKQNTTGKTKNGETFPVCLNISSVPSSEIFKIMILVYPNLSGIILLSKALAVTNFNHYFIKLLFGVSKQEIINQPITNLIPTFYKDTGLERDIRTKSPEKVLTSNFKNWFRKSELENFSPETFSNDNLNGLITSTASLSLNKSLDFNKLEETNFDSESSFKVLNTFTDSEKFEQGDTKTEYNTKDYHRGIDSNIENFSAHEGIFLGVGKHNDGSYIKIKYQVRIIPLTKDIYYCVWISRDVRKFHDFSKESMNALTAANLNSTLLPSLDESLTNSISSEQYTRPSTASIISQCDDNLKAGEYSLFYTNIKGIGKGAFGYVKMAYRNSDGLLVVTKFIKKQKINIRSWVFNPLLNMKIPLEISLLMSLQHPNIVKILDVFHNESYVQLVMEKHGAGFDLFEFINRKPKCDEKLKSYIFRQIVSAVAYLDQKGILHRDIKDENVIINEKFKVKLIDFGSATFMPLNETFSDFYGTAQFCSPEVLKGNSYKGPELEIWTLGVTLYILTFGEIPFYNFEETIKGQFSIPSPISTELNELLLKMLDKNIETRITIDKVVEDPWVTQPVFIENYSFEEVVQCYDDEAYPPKYVYEIKSDDFESKRNSEPFLDTNDSDNSLQNIAIDELGDFDENFQEKSTSIKSPESKTISPILISSTPMETKKKLHKSVFGFSKGTENSSTLSDYSCVSLQSISPASDLNFSDNFISSFKCDSPDLKTSCSLGEVIVPIFDDQEIKFGIRYRNSPDNDEEDQSQETSSESENGLVICEESPELNDENESGE